MALRPENVLLLLAVLWVKVTLALLLHPQTPLSDQEPCPQPGQEREGGMCERHTAPGRLCVDMPPADHCPAREDWLHQGSVCFLQDLAFNCSMGKWTRTDDVLLTQHREKRFLGWITAGIFGGVACFVFCTSRRRRIHPPSIKCPANIHKTAPAGQSQVKVTWNTPTASDPFGGKLSWLVGGIVKKQYGLGPGSMFSEGTTYISYEARDGNGLTADCFFYVQVKVVRCPVARAPRNGQRPQCSGAREENQFGARCHFACNQGHELQGQDTLTCQQSGRWSHPSPTCAPVSCGLPPTASGGSLQCSGGHSYQAVCSLLCQEGYSHTGAAFASCTASGRWTPVQRCKDSVAPTLPEGCPANQRLFSGPLGAPVNVTWTNPKTQDNSMQPVTLTSNRASGSLFGVGFHTVRITATDKEGNSETCTFFLHVEERECPTLSLRDGRVVCNHGNREGSTCTASCNAGYEVKGQADVTCQNDMTWSPAKPTCQKITCTAAVPEVKGGSVRCPGSVKYQEACFLSCNYGYRFQAPFFVSCKADGTWSPAGTCQDAAPPVLKCPDPVELFAAPLGQKTNVTWDPPTVSDNSGENITATSDVTPGSDFKVGVTYVTYTARDSSGNEGKCSFSVNVKTQSCSAPDVEDPARTRKLMVYQCPQGYVHGAQCTLNCTYGFPLLGAEKITCVRDDSQNPPVLSWQFDGSKPKCYESECPKLQPPENGALSCVLANYGQDCLMSCRENYDVQYESDGHFVCTNSERRWRPPTAPKCLRVFWPSQAKLGSSLLYFTNSCETSTQQIKENFIKAMLNSTYKDTCVNVQSCNVDNILVTCGNSSRRRRWARSEGSERSEVIQRRQRRQASSGSNLIHIRFDIVMDFVQNGTDEETYQVYKSLENTMHTVIKEEAGRGVFDLGSLTPDLRYLSTPTLTFDGCPNGTRYNQRFGSTKASCVGCSKGHYLKDTRCVPCPKGQYTELDNATSCTDCPQGFTTLTTASGSLEDCKKTCTPGHFSPTGLEECQPCPAGSYQSRGQSVTCDLCPAGTWTVYSASKSRSDCVAADVKLTANSSLTSSMTLEQWPVRVMTWLKLQTNTVVVADLQLPLSLSLRLTIASQGADRALDPALVASGRFLSLAVDRWTRVMAYISMGKGSLTLAVHNDSHVIFTLAILPVPLPFNTTLTITTLQGAATVSGLRGQSGVTGQQQDDLSTSSCTDQLANNTLGWNPQPASLSIPSTCYAVDQCASSPCGEQGGCENGPSGFQCHCQQGWSGDTCQVPPDGCYQHQCQEGARCVPAGRNYTCQCPENRSGRLCQFEKVDGEWGEWAQWSQCSSTCEGIHVRQRRCNNPAPANGGRYCSGQERESESCGEAKCEGNHTWSAWSSWSACSATCGGGERNRTRRCESSVPSQQGGGATCNGPYHEVTSCATAVCPVQGGWSKWSEWSPCSVTCGGGSQSRERSCDSPVPANGGRDCQGATNQTQACSSAVCPECSRLPEVHGTTFSCNETDTPYQKTCRVRCSPGYHTALPEVYSCGQMTGYRWPFQRPNATVEAKHAIHYCTPLRTPTDVIMTNTIPLNHAPCNQKYQIGQRVDTNLKALPCVQQGKCEVKVTADCPSPGISSSKRREKRNTESLTVKVTFRASFGDSLELNGSDSSRLEQFMKDFQVVDQSAALVALNDTQRLFTVTVDDVTITPDVSGSSYTSDINCSPGRVVADNGGCVDCPAGFFEEGGRCVPCPLGQYQDRAGSSHCQPCPPNTTWDTPGATHVSQCLYPTESTGTNTEEPDASQPDDSSSSSIIIGASLGALLALVVIVVVVIVMCWLRKTRKLNRPPPDGAIAATAATAETAAETKSFDNIEYASAELYVGPGFRMLSTTYAVSSRMDQSYI